MKQIVIVDIDGTISKVGERLKYIKQEPKDWDSFYEDCFDDEPVGVILALIRDLYDAGYPIALCTGRRSSCREKTVQWLNKYDCEYLTKFSPILMRPNGDMRHDIEVKPELLEIAGYTPDKVAFILEDRTSMCKKWRELGYTCLQVADGDF
ncbi:MAG: hypothetical protein GYA51_07535 [Candidatus Methanofastidiosa archaeon]|nr:hypothetical protein [Candidatus Methanofastidiosa archaeon]